MRRIAKTVREAAKKQIKKNKIKATAKKLLNKIKKKSNPLDNVIEPEWGPYIKGTPERKPERKPYKPEGQNKPSAAKMKTIKKVIERKNKLKATKKEQKKMTGGKSNIAQAYSPSSKKKTKVTPELIAEMGKLRTLGRIGDIDNSTKNKLKSVVKMKDESFMKRMKRLNQASPIEFGPKRKKTTTKKTTQVDPWNIGGKIKKTADIADKEMKNIISNVSTIAKTDMPKKIYGDVKNVMGKVTDFIKTSKSTKRGPFGK